MPLLPKVLKFFLSGGISTFINVAVLFICTHYFHIWYVGSAAIAFVVSVVASFTLQKLWTFDEKALNKVHTQFFAYAVIITVNLLLNMAIIYSLVEYLNIHYVLSQIIASALIAIESYFAYSIFVFRTTARKNAQGAGGKQASIVRKVVTFRASSIGDCLMGKYFLENARVQYPSAEFYIVVGSRGGMIRDLLREYPWIRVREVNRRNPAGVISFVKETLGSSIVLTQYTKGTFSVASKIVARFISADGICIGWKDPSPFNRFMFDQTLVIEGSESVVDLEKKALAACGISASIPTPTLNGGKQSFPGMPPGLKPRSYVVAHLFAGNEGRGLSPEKRAELIKELVAKLPSHVSIVLTGGSDNVAAAETLVQPGRVVSIAGKTTVQDSISILSQSLVVVSVDTGFAHISAQIGVPLVVTRSCIGRRWWLDSQYGSKGIKVFDCDTICAAGHDFGSYPKCMNAISMPEVADAAVCGLDINNVK